MADLRAARHLDRAFVRLSLTGEDAHQRGFAGAVAPDQRDAAPGRQRSGRTVQYSAYAKAHGDSTQVQHGGGPNRKPANLTTSGSEEHTSALQTLVSHSYDVI